MRKRRSQVSGFCFIEKGYDQQQRTARQRRRASALCPTLPLPRARLVIKPQRQMRQARQQNKYMPRAIKHPDTDFSAFKMMVELVHVLAGEQKSDEHHQPKNKVKAFHSERRHWLGLPGDLTEEGPVFQERLADT